MKYIFWGGKEIGDYVLRGLIESNNIPEGIIHYRDIISPGLIEEAREIGIPIFNVSYFKKQQAEIISFIKTLNADHYISVSCPFIISKEILDLVKYPLNIHPGDIPKYRGYHPLSAAFLNDELFQAITIHLMTEEVDAGDIILQDFVKVQNEDTIITIRQKLSELSLKLILTVIKQSQNGSFYSRSQIGEIIGAPKRKPEESKIDFARNSRYLHNFIRALVDPYPNAFAYSNGQCVKIKNSIVSNIPGVVLASLGNRQYVVSTGDGVILIEVDIDLKFNDKLE